jgi:hypothetical protein
VKQRAATGPSHRESIGFHRRQELGTGWHRLGEKGGGAVVFLFLLGSDHMARRGILWGLLSAAAFSVGLAEARVAPHAAAKQPTVNPWAFPDTFGETCVVGGSAYVNLSLPGREEKLLHLLELPRCLHEGASWKEKHGWKLHVKDKKVQRKIRWKEKRVLLAAAKKDRKEAAAAASARTAFAMPNEIRMLPANSPRLSPVCLGLTMVGPSLFGRGVVGAGSGRSSLCSLVPGPGAAAAAPASLLLHRPFGDGLGSSSKIAMDAGKGFGLSAPGGDQGKPGKGKDGKTSGLRGSGPGKVREVEMQFTCNKCETRQSKKFTRHAYEKGIVIVNCDGCGVKQWVSFLLLLFICFSLRHDRLNPHSFVRDSTFQTLHQSFAVDRSVQLID